MTDEISEILALATELARSAGDLTLEYFGGVVDADSKGDGTPVTIADRNAEKLIRQGIQERFPDHGVLGEEFGEANPGARVRWILDPIDGTRSFMHGVPLYGVLIGVEVEGEPAVGVANFPPLGELVAAGQGMGCTLNGEPCSVSGVSELADALVLTTDAERILARDIAEGWRALATGAAFSRTWGDCYGHMLVATGRAEVMVDPLSSIWDMAPLLTIVTEAGGSFTDLSGQATIDGGSGVSTNGVLHETVLGMLRKGCA